MIRINVSIENDKGNELFSSGVTLTNEAWPPTVKEWRKACELAHILLWEAHPTYEERNKALSDHNDMMIEKDAFTDENIKRQRELLGPTLMDEGH